MKALVSGQQPLARAFFGLTHYFRFNGSDNIVVFLTIYFAL